MTPATNFPRHLFNQRMIEPIFNTVPCGGMCDEIEDWASLEDDDYSIEYPCDGCIYEYYLTGDDDI